MMFYDSLTFLSHGLHTAFSVLFVNILFALLYQLLLLLLFLFSMVNYTTG